MYNSAKNVGDFGQKRQSSILDHFRPVRTAKRAKPDCEEDRKESLSEDPCTAEALAGSIRISCSNDGFDWEVRANSLLGKHFGYSSLKSFQREALSAWSAHRDCLVLAATGSGKSLCFQIPALLTGKVVIVISPLISLMHDQCMKLAKHGISACFLGSGQPDRTIEDKAMRGVYSVVYVCPETVLRLIKPLEKLAECRGIALFAIDEVHCVSKWGHDFRPDYRRLFVLRETFTTKKLNFLQYDVPIMALTATATVTVREDILASMSMSTETEVVVTSFFRPNLRFSVKHSRTSSPLSFKRDFHELVETYSRKRKTNMSSSRDFNDAPDNALEADDVAGDDFSDVENDDSDREDKPYSKKQNGLRISKENEFDVFHDVLDWDVSYGEFCAQDPPLNRNIIGSSELLDPSNACEESSDLGSTIIYVPTRKQTLKIAEYLCECGVKAAAYHAALPKSHLRQVHKEFHEETIEVVVATIAFGMGIDKLNVRRIIHYGWPQDAAYVLIAWHTTWLPCLLDMATACSLSLEAYYQEAGRAGRDGKLAHCTLIANLKRTPSLFPNKRSEEQTKQAYKMLTDCFRYGMNNTCCRAKKLVEYFGENTSFEKCQLCDVCMTGPPEMQNLKEEAGLFLQVIVAYHARDASDFGSYCDGGAIRQQRFARRPNLRVFVSAIREQSRKFMGTDRLWWQGLARIMEDRGLLREGDNKIHVQIRIPEPTKLGLKLLESKEDQDFFVYPEADMLLCAVSNTSSRPFSSFSSWKNGWADPEIRRQRLERLQSKRSSPRKPSNWKPRNRKPRVRNLQ